MAMQNSATDVDSWKLVTLLVMARRSARGAHDLEPIPLATISQAVAVISDQIEGRKFMFETVIL